MEIASSNYDSTEINFHFLVHRKPTARPIHPTMKPSQSIASVACATSRKIQIKTINRKYLCTVRSVDGKVKSNWTRKNQEFPSMKRFPFMYSVVHPSCIEMSSRMALRVREYDWQCAECKCCIKCKQEVNEDKMLYCDQCDRGYHIYCIGIKAVPSGEK